MRMLILCMALLAGCASLKDSTHIATAADAATSAIGVTSGLAVEANPLITSPLAFAGMMAARMIATEQINAMPEPQRTTYLSAMSSVWLAPGISNALIIVGASGPAGLVAGVMAGLGWWVSTADRRLFAELCAAEMALSPAIICEWKS